MDKFLNLVLGTNDVPTYLAAFLFAFMGMGIYWKWKVSKRNKASRNTPFHFSWSFFTQDNLVEIVFNLMSIFLAMRFSVEYAGVEVTMWYSLGIGFGLPRFIQYLYSIQQKARK